MQLGGAPREWQIDRHSNHLKFGRRPRPSLWRALVQRHGPIGLRDAPGLVVQDTDVNDFVTRWQPHPLPDDIDDVAAADAALPRTSQ